MASTKLSRTFTSGNTDKWTFSTWIKKAELGSGSTDANFIFCGYADASNYTSLHFDTDDTLHFYNRSGGGAAGQQVTSALFRDPTAWLNLVCVWDSGNASSTDRMKLYVNGEEVTAFAVDNAPNQDLDSSANVSGNTCYLGTQSGSNMYFNGALAHSHFCDGQAYAVSDFGETDSTSGIWVAKTSPSVTYGTNGFFLKYASGASGTDSSGEGNNFTVSGTLTNLKDNPDNNFCTWNPLNKDHGETYTFENVNTTCKIPSASGWSGSSGTLFAGAGKWYVEGYINYTPGANNTTFGFASDKAIAMKSAYGQIGYMDKGAMADYAPTFGVYDTGTLLYSTTSAINQQTGSWTTEWAAGDYLMFAIDIDNGKFYYGVNGSWTGASSNPTAGTGGYSFTPGGFLYTPMTTVYQETLNVNFGAGYFGTTVAGTNTDGAGLGAFKYTPPTNYYALCTKNLKTYG